MPKKAVRKKKPSKTKAKPASKKKTPSKQPKTRKTRTRTAKGKEAKIKAPTASKCCSHCPDYEYCEDRGECCEYCDYYLNGRCMYGKKTAIPHGEDGNIELPDYRGDDYGIDDYEAYETVYE